MHTEVCMRCVLTEVCIVHICPVQCVHVNSMQTFLGICMFICVGVSVCAYRGVCDS